MNTTADIAEVVELTSICSTFPERLENEFPRDNMISTLLAMLKSNNEIVVVEGEEGGGKTTLLAQFARAHSMQTFSAFVKDSSQYAWDPIMVAQNLHEQIQFALGNIQFRKHAETEVQGQLRQSITELQRRSNRERKIYYFIVDGLDELPPEANAAIEHIMECLPIGLSTFRFLLSGSVERLMAYRRGRVTLKPWTLPWFSLDETAKYFKDVPGTEEHIQTIYKLSNKGIPGKLALIRRLCGASQIPVDQMLTNLGDHAPDLLETEWKNVLNGSEDMQIALAALCFDRRRHNVETLAALCGVEQGKLEAFIDRCTFLQTSSAASREITFAPYFKRFATKNLEGRRKDIIGLAIAQLTRQPDSKDALTHLPIYLNESGKHEELLQYLSPEHIGKMIECSESWLPLHQKADLGVATSKELKRDGDLLRFGMQRSAVTSLESCERRRSEIEAYIALGDFKSAYAVAQAAIAKEDRLHILAIIGSAKRKRKLPIEPELKEQIRQLYNQIEKVGLGNRVVEIAIDLFSCDPELAIDLIHTSQPNAASQMSLDIAFANLSLNTLLQRTQEADSAETGAKMRAQLKSPEIQKFVDTISVLWGGYTGAEVIELINKWENAADRIYVMRIWTATNRQKKDAAAVVEHAFDTIIKATNFAANAKIYRELAMPLPYVPSAEIARKLIARFDGIKAIIEPVGPTEEYVWLQLLLATAEAEYDKAAALNRFTDVYLYIGYLKDLATKATCIARLTSALQRADPKREVDSKGDLHKAATDDLEKFLLQLLTETADHYRAVEPAIHALTGSAPERALALANALNTEPRRDAALVKIVESLGARDPQRLDSGFLERVLGQIKYTSNKNRALLTLLRGLELNKKKAGPLMGMLQGLAQKSKNMTSPEARCQLLLLLHSICAEHKEKIAPTHLEFIRGEIETSWGEIDVGYERIDLGFQIVAEMAAGEQQFAQSFLTKVQADRKAAVLDCEDCSHTHLMCCRLAIRSFSGLIPQSLYGKEDITDLGMLINEVPGASIRALAWSDIAIRLYVDKAEVDCREIVNEQVKRAIIAIPEGAKEQRATTIIGAAPALFCAHPGTAEEMIETLAPHERDEAYARICEFLLTKELPFEPYDGDRSAENHLEVVELWDICKLLAKMRTDHIVYAFFERLVRNVEEKRNWNRYKREQRADIISKLQGLLCKFPSPNFIQHEGYRILAEGQMARFEKKGPGIWDGLITRARNLPNQSDQAYVMAELAGAMPDIPSLTGRKRNLYAEATQKTATLSSLQDRIQRYISIYDAALDFDRSICRKALEAATADSMVLDTEDVGSVRQRLVDMAYRINADFAATLASGLDKDHARKAKQLEMEQRLQTLKLRDSLQNGDGGLPEKNAQDEHGERAAEAAWMALRSLHSGKTLGIDIAKARNYVQSASAFPLKQAYPVLAFVIENAVRAHKKDKEAATYLKPLFKATLLGAELTYRIAAKCRNMADAQLLNASAQDRDQSLIQSGEREKALEKIKNWVKANAKGYVIICDYYFAPENLDIVQLIRAENREIPIAILTSRQHQIKENVQQPWEEAYQAYWRLHISEADPGEVRIVILGTKETGAMPIHDRWCLSEGSGLRLGSSLNSIGAWKASEVTEIAAKDLPGITDLVNRHLGGIVTTSTGERLLPVAFYLA